MPCLSFAVSGHIIEVLASQKVCFFEDLHVNDKVSNFFRFMFQYFDVYYLDDSDISSWRGRKSRYRFLGWGLRT